MAAKPAFRSQMASMPVRVLFGAIMYGVLCPVMRIAEKRGGATRLLTRMSTRQQKERREKNPFLSYTPTEHDVFIATFAKSGTNWMMQIVHQLVNRGQGEFDHIHSVVPWPDGTMIPPLRRYAIPVDDPSVWMASPEKKRAIKTHFDWDMLPYSPKARYIAVIRDPKDVFVSSYFFVKEGVLGPAMPSVDTWYKMFLSDHFMLGGSWAANTAGYWAQRHLPNVLIVSFKEMKRDLRGVVEKVAAFLDVEAPEQTIDSVREKSTFDYMKRIDRKFYMGSVIPWKAGGVMMRKGKQGASSELLSPERQREVDEFFIAELKRLGSDFPYEEFCDVSPSLANQTPIMLK